MTAGLGDPLTEHGTVAPVVLLKTTLLGGSAINFGLEISASEKERGNICYTTKTSLNQLFTITAPKKMTCS